MIGGKRWKNGDTVLSILSHTYPAELFYSYSLESRLGRSIVYLYRISGPVNHENSAFLLSGRHPYNKRYPK